MAMPARGFPQDFTAISLRLNFARQPVLNESTSDELARLVPILTTVFPKPWFARAVEIGLPGARSQALLRAS
jgi:hypothetical protein